MVIQQQITNIASFKEAWLSGLVNEQDESLVSVRTCSYKRKKTWRMEQAGDQVQTQRYLGNTKDLEMLLPSGKTYLGHCN